ncbi:ABC transporter related protein [Spirochaeta thermophila DSM 6578]|uniref:ABC transporter related protein n=1 Tax=Winmispira thermophila (strain ATCC 700085 / DSM 6578 / Z-1203) TaxID=869211 RepID=G0GB35_WINT7|nr:ABC transporter ATP-binding protein [Spirochaeta thermophila]AEJ61059.1 ABC transporter related protein [Spirochaeta thermophila DSM 6578]
MSIVLEGVSHRFPDGSWGLKDVSLTIWEGERLLVVGRNGSGKTLLMRHLVGLAQPTEGRVLVDGRDVRQDPFFARRRVGLVFQSADAQLVRHTVRDEVALGPENMGLPGEEVARRVEQVMARLGISQLAARHPRTLSGGEKRRVAIAGVLVMEPAYLVLDEPFANLDLPGIRNVLEALDALAEEGRGWVVISHEAWWLRGRAERVVAMEGGRVVLEGRPDEVAGRLEALGIWEGGGW